MENILLVLNFLVLGAVVSIGLLLKHYLSPYLREKGKNLATKKDIEEITNKIERVKSQYVAEIEKLKSELQNQSQVLGRRREVDDNVAKSLNVFLTDRVDTEEQKKKFLEAYASTWLWAPDAVVKALNSLIDLVTVSQPTKTAEQEARKVPMLTVFLK